MSALATFDPRRAEQLGAENRALFRTCDFWPNGVMFTGGDSTAKPVQPLVAVQTVIGKYARRLMTMREALLDYVRPDVPWMVPDLIDLFRDEELEDDERVDLTALSSRLKPIAAVAATELMLKVSLHERPELSMNVFGDGRMIVFGPTDPALARSMYARVVGL